LEAKEVSALGRNILVRGVNWLGDAVMTTPALQRLREAAPGSRITLLTHTKLKDLWSGYPYLDEVITFTEGESVFEIARRLRGRFDAALILPNSPRSALEAFLARVPIRIGSARCGRSWLLTKPVPARAETVHLQKRSVAEIRHLVKTDQPRASFPASAHQIHDYLHLLGAMGFPAEPVAPMLHVSDKEVAAVRARFFRASDKPWLGLNPGAEYGPAKRWPAGQYISAANELRHATGCECVVFGGPQDKPITEKITAEIGALDLTGKTTLRELAACFGVCRVLLTNDSGPMHVAAAVGTPVIVPFGSTAPELTGPGSPHAIVLKGDVSCAPCFRRECPIDFRCMRSITVEQVVQSARPLLS
jgi:heptosyltransferase-2